MTVEELIVYGNKYLHKDQIKLILATLLEIDSLELTFHLQEQVNLETVARYKRVISYINDGKPIQYALNNACFYGYDYYVNENVLIPRFETEELVYHVINYIKKYFVYPNVLDMCAGSGCIGLTLKKEYPRINLTLADISKEALEVLKINQSRLNVEADVVLSDLFANITSKYDVIVANPPYIAFGDEVDDLVKNNEPEIALYADNNGLAIYERLFADCERYLNDRYMIAVEIGASQKDSVISIINKHLKNVCIIAKCDANKRDRMIFVFKNINLNE